MSYISYLEFIRFKAADDDCTEALNIDDRYIKAYPRWRELGKLNEAMNGDMYYTPIMCIDPEFAISLDPNNPELRK
jgi:RNA polymerase II-associated protein 3